MVNLMDILKNKGITTLYAYSRKSRDIDGEGLQKHHDILKQFSESVGLPVTILEEVGSSETLNREMLNEIRNRVKAGEIKCLLVYRLDRLSRKVTDAERLLKEFDFNNLLLIEAHNSRVINYSDKTNKMTFIMNDFYLDHAKEVLNAGKIKSVSLYGNHLGEAPLGYSYNRTTKKLEPNQDKHIVEEIYDLYLHNMNLFDVAIEMNKRGYKTRDGNIFTHKTVRDTLTNEKYIGTQIYGKRKWFKDEHGKKISKSAPESEWIVYQNAHEPIITQEAFQKVADKLKDNRIVDVNSRKRTYGLTSIIKCGYCGRNITFYKDSNNGKTYMKPCAKIDFITGKRCPNSATSLQLVDDFIYHHIWEVVRPAMDYVNTIAAKNTKIVNTNTARIKGLTAEMKDINKKLDNLLEMMLVRGGTDSRLIEKENQLKYRLSQIEQELSSLEHDSTGKDWWDVFCELQRDLFAVPFKWKSPDPTVRNTCLKKYIDKVVYTKNEVDPSNPHFEIHYTETVKQAIEIYQQYKQELRAKRV